MLKHLSKFSEYIPILLLGLYFVSESDLKNHIKKNSIINIIIYIISLIVLYILLSHFNISCKQAIGISILVWAFLKILKKCIQPNLHY